MRRIRNFQWDWPALIYILICVTAAIAFALLYAFQRNDHNSLKREANIRATQIQQQRYDATFDACMDTNQRHRRTITTLNNIIDGLPADQRTQAEQSKEFTILLIDAIIPIRNCRVVAKQAVHALPAPNNPGR